MLVAINEKHQAAVKKAVQNLMKYSHHNDLRDMYSDNGDDRNEAKQDKLCEKYFNKYLEIAAELPQREVENIEKSIYY